MHRHWKRGIAGVATLAGALVACGASEPAGRGETVRHEVRQSLVEFRPDPERWVSSSGEPQMRWLGVSGEARRALECSADCRIALRPGDFAGGRLQATAAVLPGSADGRSFEVRTGSGRWKARLAPGESRLLEVALGAGSEAVELVIDAEPGAGPSRAVWLEPTFVREREGPAARPGLPNVVLITSDTTRQDELGCYGGPVPTPAIDRLAAEGVVFDDAHAIAFGTNPSHASLMTSSPASRHGVIHNRKVLGDELTTLAEALRDRGYATAAFVSAVVLIRRSGLARGFDLYDDSVGLERPGDLTVRLFGSWLRENARTPFFVWIHLYDPHQPYAPPDAVPAPEVDRVIAAANGRGVPGFIDPARIQADAPDRLEDVGRVARERYRGEIAFVDRQVAAIRARLERRGVLGSTLLVFTADHGENFLDRGPDVAFDHAGTRGDVTRVPLIFRVPGASLRGRSDALVGNHDIAPTILAWAGIEPDPGWSGRVLLSPNGIAGGDFREHLVLEGSHRREVGVLTRDWLYREARDEFRESSRILRVQGFEPGSPFELYRRASDPDERRNVYADDHPAIGPLREILARFDAAGTSDGPEMPIDADHRRALEALGYVEAPTQDGTLRSSEPPPD